MVASSRRRALIAVLVLACACTQDPETRASRAIETATDALRRGDPARADALVDEGLAIVQSRSDGPLAWRLRLLKAEALLGKRDLARATEIVKAPIPDAPQYRQLRARQRYLEARVEYSQGRLPQALAIGKESLEAADPGTELQLEIAGFVGQLGLQQGRWAEAEAQLATVIANAEAAGYRHVEAMALLSQGMGKFVRSRCDEALPSFERAASLPGIADTPAHAKALYNAGMCYSRLGQYDRAVDVQRRAIAAAERRPASSDYEQALGQLGNTYLLQRNARDGLAYLQRAHKAALDSKLTADAAIWAGNLAVAYIGLKEWDEAERFNEEAKRLAAASRSGRPIYNLANTAAIAAGRGQYDEATRLFGQVLASDGAPAPVVWEAHYRLANIAIAQQQRQRAAKSFEAALDVIEKTRAGLLRTDYKLSYLTQLIEFYRAYVDQLIAQGEVDRALAVADSSRGRVLAERQGAPPPARTDAAHMRALARKTGATYLSYWLTPARSYVWVLDGGGIKVLTLPASGAIEALAGEHRAAIANSLVDPLGAKDSAGDRLFRTLVAPAAASLAPGASVIVVPDGALHGLNLETLPVDGPRRHYWIEDVELQIAPSLASLTAEAPTAASPPATASALLVGNAVGRPPEFPELKYAANEMTTIARHFGAERTTVVDRERATPAAYRDARPATFRFVHFAAHATANVESPLDSAVILSGPEQAYKLYARDVAAVPLAADLVTVSACRSAGERAYSGEGLVGFAWAFLRAGARRVVAGLWDVNDRSTADLMGRMYQGLAAGATPPGALRAAKLDLIRQGGASASPYAWGAFELFTVTP